MNDKLLKHGSKVLSVWCVLNFIFSTLILSIVAFGIGDSPLLSMVFEKSEIAALSTTAILSLNCITILYNSYAVAFCVISWLVIRYSLRKGAKWAFWALLITIGFVEIFAFIASAPLGHVRWQFNAVLSALYITGISLTGCALFRKDQKPQQGTV